MTKKPSASTTPVHPVVEFMRTRRVADGISQKDFAEATGQSQATVSNTENGDFSPKLVAVDAGLRLLGYKLAVVSIDFVDIT